jgi:hypothetical protein
MLQHLIARRRLKFRNLRRGNTEPVGEGEAVIRRRNWLRLNIVHVGLVAYHETGDVIELQLGQNIEKQLDQGGQLASNTNTPRSPSTPQATGKLGERTVGCAAPGLVVGVEILVASNVELRNVACGSALLVSSAVCDLLVRSKVVDLRLWVDDDVVESVEGVVDVVESVPGVRVNKAVVWLTITDVIVLTTV